MRIREEARPNHENKGWGWEMRERKHSRKLGGGKTLVSSLEILLDDGTKPIGE